MRTCLLRTFKKCDVGQPADTQGHPSFLHSASPSPNGAVSGTHVRTFCIFRHLHFNLQLMPK